MIYRVIIYLPRFLVIVLISGSALLLVHCKSNSEASKQSNVKSNSSKNKYKLPDIDLSHWKVTIPEGQGKGGAISVEPPEILEYGTNEMLKHYMYNDSTSKALVFYAFPSNATTANTKYSRSELREQIEPGNDDANWTFEDGGKLKATIEMEDLSKDEEGKYHKVIILQIHGRLTDAQKDLIGQKDNNAPPILKVYWDKGRIRVKTKKLKFLETNNEGLLYEEAWTDDDGYTFKEEVGFKKFDIGIEASKGKLVVSLNKNEFKVYEDIHMEKWGVFENYFKAGNYLQTRDTGAFAKVKFYELEVSH